EPHCHLLARKTLEEAFREGELLLTVVLLLRLPPYPIGILAPRQLLFENRAIGVQELRQSELEILVRLLLALRSPFASRWWCCICSAGTTVVVVPVVIVSHRESPRD